MPVPDNVTGNPKEDDFGWREFITGAAGVYLVAWLAVVHMGAAFFIKAAIMDRAMVGLLMWSGPQWLWLAAFAPAALSGLLWLLWTQLKKRLLGR